MIAKDKILVIDDEPDMLEAIQYALSARGYDVLTALDGDIGLEKAEAENPDLIVTDLLMPTIDGWRVCQRLKGIHACKSTPVIMVSAVVDDQMSTSDMELGDCYLSKPFAMQTLLDMINRLLERREADPNE